MDKKKCTSCGEAPKKCSCKNKEFTKAVVEINNPNEVITLIRKVVIPASMGDDTTVPPAVGKYKNVLLYYEANGKSYLYSSDGIPTQLVNGFTNYEEAINLPQINGVTLLGDKSAADLKLADAPMVITVANGNTSWSGADTAEDVYDFFLNKGKVNIIFNGEKNYSYEIASAAYIPEEEKMMCTLAVATIVAGETSEFEGNALFGTMTLYTANKAIDVSQIELQPKLFVTDFTGLDLYYNELSGVPATTYSIGMVKPGDGLNIKSDGTLTTEARVFDTVADMKAATNLASGSYAKTLGYHAINDGGGGLYKITNTGTANEMDVIAVGDLFANLLIDENLIPQQFGAYGDSVHDDTAIIQECINYVSEKPIKLFLVSKYLVSPIVTTSSRKVCFEMKTNVTIEGNGKSSGFIIDDTNNNVYWAVFYSVGSNTCKNIEMRNFQIFQNDNNLSDIETTNNNPRYVIYFTSAITNLLIDNILFDHVYSRDVVMINNKDNTSNVVITNCVFNYFNVLDRVSCSDCSMVFLNCKNYVFNDNVMYGANFTCMGGLELHGNNGTAKNNGIFGFTDAVHIDPAGSDAANIELENNTIYGYDGVMLWDNSESGTAYGLQGTRVLNNYIKIESGANAHQNQGGIRLSGTAFIHPVTDVIIEGNTIEFVNIDTTRTISNANCGGIVLNNAYADIENVYIRNNTILNSIACGIRVGSTSGTATTTNSYVYVCENIIKDNAKIPGATTSYDASIAINKGTLKNIVVKDNMLINTAVSGGSHYAFYGSGTVDPDNECFFSDNIVKTSASGEMLVSGISGWVYKNTKQIPIFSPNGTKYYIKVANDGTLSTSAS